MKRSWKRSVAVCLAVTLAAGTLAGCGGGGSSETTAAPESTTTAKTTAAAETTTAAETTAAETTAAETSQEETQAAAEGLSYPIADAGSFTLGYKIQSSWSDRYDAFDEIPLGQALEEQTGYDIEMVHVADNTAMNLLLASGDLPDAIIYNFYSNYNGREAKAVSDGVIYPMTEEFVKENAPDYWKVISADPDILKAVKTPEGDIWGFAFILGDRILRAGYSMFVRDDWCEELGLELPETVDEYYEMLKAFKEKKGVEIPLCVDTGTLGSMLNKGSITSPFGLPTADIYLDNGQVTVGYAQQEFKGVLEWLNKLYAEGLLDPNFATVDTETVQANLLTGKAGASAGACGSVLGTLLQTASDDEDFSLAGITNLVANKGDVPMYSQCNTTVVGGGIGVITSSAKDPAKIARFFNYGYTDAGHLLYNYGIEGESYEMVDGKPVYTDLVLHNPDGLTVKQALSEYVMAWDNGPFVQDKEFQMQYYTEDAQKDALEKSAYSNAEQYVLPRITISSEDTNEYSSLVSELGTYRDEMIIKFIRGEEPLDNFDNYLSTLDSMGVDRLREIVQNAVDEFNAR